MIKFHDVLLNKLTYEAHTDVVCGKIAGKLKHLEALQGKASFKTLKEVTVSLIHSTIEFCAELYLVNYRNQVKVQKKLNSTMRMLLDWGWEASCTDMMSLLNWLNIPNMRIWCCVRTLKRIMTSPGQTPNTWEVVNMNDGALHDVRYRAVKLNWRRFTHWARSSFIYQATNFFMKRAFTTKKEAKNLSISKS